MVPAIALAGKQTTTSALLKSYPICKVMQLLSRMFPSFQKSEVKYDFTNIEQCSLVKIKKITVS